LPARALIQELPVKLAPLIRLVIALATIAIGMGAYSLLVAMQTSAM